MRRWEELRPELDALGIQILAVCTDKPAMIKSGQGMHGLQAIFVADPSLEVVDKFGLRNHNLQIKPPNVPGLPVPTTIITDEQGVVRWLDQAEHYSHRSDPERVRAALAQAFR